MDPGVEHGHRQVYSASEQSAEYRADLGTGCTRSRAVRNGHHVDVGARAVLAFGGAQSGKAAMDQRNGHSSISKNSRYRRSRSHWERGREMRQGILDAN